MNSYCDTLVTEKVVEGKDAAGAPLQEGNLKKGKKPHALTFRWQRGPEAGGFFLSAPTGFGIGGDQDNVAIWFPTPDQKQGYVQLPFAQRAELPDRASALRMLFAEHPLLSVLTGVADGPLCRYLTLEQVKPTEREGIQGKEVTGTCRSLGQPDQVAPLWMFFADDTGLLVAAGWDETRLYNEQFAGLKSFTKVTETIRCTEVRIDDRLSPSSLGFQPSEKARRFDKLRQFADMEAPLPAPEELVGKHAPAWKATDDVGAAAALGDFAGKVLVMDFWASWCGPCVAALPHVEELRKQYEARGVMFVGITLERDQKGIDRSRRLVAEHRVGSRQFRDDGRIAEAYRAHSIPHLVIVDRAGVIRDIVMGFGPGTEARIAASIERVLVEPSPAGR